MINAHFTVVHVHVAIPMYVHQYSHQCVHVCEFGDRVVQCCLASFIKCLQFEYVTAIIYVIDYPVYN